MSSRLREPDGSFLATALVLPRRISPAMVQLALDPIQLFLFVEPGLRQRIRTKSAATSLQQVDHGKSVVTLPPLDPEPAPNPPKERFRLLARSPPCPAVSRTTLALGDSNDPTAPNALHPVKHRSIDIRNDNLYSVDIPAALGLERSNDPMQPSPSTKPAAYAQSAS